MTDPKSRLRVQRLLRGEFRPDDLTALFLYARDHCDGREALSDIGHFVAHHHERDRGIVTRSTREWFHVVRFHMPRFRPGGPYNFDWDKLPPSTKDYFSIAIKRIGRNIIKRDTGLLERQANDVMQGVIIRLIRNDDGTWVLPSRLTEKEYAVVRCACRYIAMRGAFEDAVLFSDFLATLKSNGIITREELRTKAEDIRPLVYLFAVAAMHNSILQIGDGTTTQLVASSTGTTIEVLATVPATYPHAPDVGIAAPIFVANLDPAIHCHPELGEGEWLGEIELSMDKRLSPLR